MSLSLAELSETRTLDTDLEPAFLFNIELFGVDDELNLADGVDLLADGVDLLADGVATLAIGVASTSAGFKSVAKDAGVDDDAFFLLNYLNINLF